MRKPNTEYRRVLQEVLDYGIPVPTQQGTNAIRLIGPKPMRFKLAECSPFITERNLNPKISENLPVTIWQQAIGEIFGFINGARTQSDLEKFGCYWWKDFVSAEKCRKRGYETGDLGDGSYGAAFHDFPTTEGVPFNQFAGLIEETKENPHLRTLFVSPWIPQYVGRRRGVRQRVVVAPCHGWIHLDITPDRKLTLHMFQRSADLVVGVPSNMVQYGEGLIRAIAHVLDVEPYEYVHSFSNAHIYVDHLPAVKKILDREPRPSPDVTLNNPPNDLFLFRKEHFVLSNYDPHPGIRNIPVAI